MHKIKICGMMSEADIDISSGADILGFVMAPGSKRELSLERTKHLIKYSKKYDVKTAVVLTSKKYSEIEAIMSTVNPDIMQLHYLPDHAMLSRLVDSIAYAGKSKTEICVSMPVPYIPETDVEGFVSETSRVLNDYFERGVEYIILDTMAPLNNRNLTGGTGITHNWNISAQIVKLTNGKIFIAGGLTPDNVNVALRVTSAYGVDVSSGVEYNDRTGKDPVKVQKFLDEVKGLG